MTSTVPTATASSTPSADWGRDVRALLRAGLRGQGRRLLSAGLAVGLGVMFLAVTLLLSDTLAAGLRTQVAGSIGDYTAVVSDDSGEITPAQEQTVRRTTGVAAVEAVQSRTIISGGNTVVGLATAPTQGRGSYPQGRAPRTDGEIALTENALAALSVDVGGTVSVPAESGPPGAAAEPVVLRVVGVVEPSGDTTFPTSMPAGVATNATMSRLAGKTSYLELRVVGTPGTSPEQLRDALTAAIGPGPAVRTGAEEVDHRVQQLAGGHDLLTQVLVGFAAVALFTCMIVVANTFTILLAQRQRQLALLRCVGAGRGQIVRSVLAEAVILGALASLAGLVLAVGLGELGVFAADRYLADVLPVDGLVVSPVALLAPFGVGIVLTVLAALLPAVRATRTSPLAALRPETPPTGRVRVVRVVLGVLGVGAGVGLLGWGVSQGDLTGGIAGGFLSFAGVLALGPVLVPLLVGAVRGLARVSVGAPGALAVENARRNPRRAAATTSALLIGVTLITMMTVGATIARTVSDEEISGQVPVDAVVSSATGEGVTAAQVERLRTVPGIEATTVIHEIPEATIRGREETVVAMSLVDPEVRDVLRAPRLVEGLAPGVVLLDPTTAANAGVVDGGAVTVPWGRATARVAKVGAPVAPVSDVSGRQGRAVVWLRMADDADPDEVSNALNRAAADEGGLQVSSPAAARAELDRAVDAVLLVTIALLAVAVLIALVGVGNTLGLSVIERTRESALLRALGLTGRQLRGMLAVEAAVLSAVAVVLGVAMGIGYGWAGIATLFADIADDGVPLVVPWARIALVAAVAIVAGLLASVLPARHAALVAPAAALAGE